MKSSASEPGVSLLTPNISIHFLFFKKQPLEVVKRSNVLPFRDQFINSHTDFFVLFMY